MNKEQLLNSQDNFEEEKTEKTEIYKPQENHEMEVIREKIEEEDAKNLEKVKNEIMGMTATESKGILSKEQIIKRVQAEEIHPQKPNLKEFIAWALKTRFGQKYDSSLGAVAYDKMARYHFAREKVAKDITLAFLENIPEHPKDALICERAAGTGIITEALIAAGYNVRASDLSKEQLELLSKRLPNVKTVFEDFNEPMQCVEDESVDGIVEVAADRYMTPEGQANYVREAYKKLKKDGILLWPVFLGEFVKKLRNGFKWKAGEKQISELLESNGFEILSNKRYVHGLNATKIFRLLVAKKMQKL